MLSHYPLPITVISQPHHKTLIGPKFKWGILCITGMWRLYPALHVYSFLQRSQGKCSQVHQGHQTWQCHVSCWDKAVLAQKITSNSITYLNITHKKHLFYGPFWVYSKSSPFSLVISVLPPPPNRYTRLENPTSICLFVYTWMTRSIAPPPKLHDDRLRNIPTSVVS